jgi:alkanesulfonate monooxygenase SsuD/methylene tetrahydromethanopterin reductase-like flavin-dependent oxidoreductase (luciferase family)
MTFRFASVLAKQAAADDALSGGRLLLGVGAGWNKNEHTFFHLPFYTERERFELLEQGIAAMREILAATYPKPARDPIPLLIGGKGTKRTLPLAAREAAEWNLGGLDAAKFRELNGTLDRLCREAGRDPSEIKRSIMSTYLIGRNAGELRDRAAQLGQVLTSLHGKSPEAVLQTMRSRAFVGQPEEIAEQMREQARAGVQLIMLQHFLLDDSDALQLLAKEVLPAVA